jgi:hypothetical protein
LSGVIPGTQAQPAVLASANERTGSDARVAVGYALVHPAAMIVKSKASSSRPRRPSPRSSILLAQVLAGLSGRIRAARPHTFA